jgi:hypothetical protein
MMNVALVAAPHVFTVRAIPAPSQPTADIFHVPLFG